MADQLLYASCCFTGPAACRCVHVSCWVSWPMQVTLTVLCGSRISQGGHGSCGAIAKRSRYSGSGVAASVQIHVLPALAIQSFRRSADDYHTGLTITNGPSYLPSHLLERALLRLPNICTIVGQELCGAWAKSKVHLQPCRRRGSPHAFSRPRALGSRLAAKGLMHSHVLLTSSCLPQTWLTMTIEHMCPPLQQ